MSLFSPNPAKRAVERYWLLYTPVWGIISAVVMVGGFADTWTDVPCMIYGVVLMAGAVVPPIVMRPESDREGPWWTSTAAKLVLSVTGLSFGLNYSQTPYFYDVLHMHYGFGTTWNIQNNPVFLYLVSVAYFATYCVLCMMAFRLMRRIPGAPGTFAAYIVAPLLMAFFETLLNANPFIGRLFCYDDLPLMLWFGTLSYGAAFIFVMPLWMRIDERPSGEEDTPRVTALAVVIGLGAVLYADVLALDTLRYHVAPHVTEVHHGANGLRDYEGSCLEPPHEDAPWRGEASR